MTSSNDDCYFFYYSSCTKGDLCPFRHEEAALGSEKVCNLWEENRCFRQVCKFRHMQIQKDRSNITCFWESQPGGCRKPHCVFKHGSEEIPSRAPQQIVATAVTQQPHKDMGQMYDYESQSRSQVTLPTRADGSPATGPGTPCTPKVEQMVINPFDEETDEESIVGTPVKKPVEREKEVVLEGNKVVSLKKPSRQWSCGEEESGESLQFEIKSLDEIRREKIAKARLSIEDADSYMISAADMAADQVEPAEKKIKLSVSESKTDIKVKSLEEIRREKALQSLKEAQKAKAKLNTIQKKSVQAAPENQEVTRRIVISAEEEKPATKRSMKDRLGSPLKDRLGQKQAKTSDVENKKGTNVKPTIKDRLGTGETRKISLVKKKENSANIVIRSLSELKKEKSKIMKSLSELNEKEETKTPAVLESEVKVRSLADIRKEKQKALRTHRVVVDSDDSTELKGLPTQPVKQGATFRSSREVSKATEIENNASVEKKPSPRKPRQPRIQLYKPPALKRKATEEAAVKIKEEAAAKIKVEKVEQPEPKKASKWGAKTFSEIMREKQMKLREKQAQKQDSCEIKTEIKTEPKPEEHKARSTVSPVKFDRDSITSPKKKKSPFTPIVFDLIKKETVDKIKVERTPLTYVSDKDSVPKSTRQNVTSVKTVIPSNNPAKEEELPDSPKISISPIARVVEGDSCDKTVSAHSEQAALPQKAVTASSAKTPARKISLSRPAGQSAERQSAERQSAERPGLRRRSLRSSGSADKLKPSITSEKSVDKSARSELDDSDILDKALEAFFGDEEVDVADTGSADDDDLLQEMEELLA